MIGTISKYTNTNNQYDSIYPFFHNPIVQQNKKGDYSQKGLLVDS